MFGYRVGWRTYRKKVASSDKQKILSKTFARGMKFCVPGRAPGREMVSKLPNPMNCAGELAKLRNSNGDELYK